jgi:SAM-dependent methyltransferase
MDVNLVLKKAYRQLYRAVQVNGPLGTLRLAAEKMRYYGRRLSALGVSSLPAVSTFDQKWNVQTDGNEDLSELQVVDKTNYLLGNRYQPTAPEMFDRILHSYPLPYEECIFIDCGSGKGRVLLLASEFPFRRIIGVEFASDLTDIAQANIRAYNSPTQKCKHLEAVCADATTFPFPPLPTVLYMANPFEGEVMMKFLRHVENSLIETPRTFFVLYRNPKYANLWDESKHFRKVNSTEEFIVYKGQ